MNLIKPAFAKSVKFLLLWSAYCHSSIKNIDYDSKNKYVENDSHIPSN